MGILERLKRLKGLPKGKGYLRKDGKTGLSCRVRTDLRILERFMLMWQRWYKPVQGLIKRVI
jgi:hypothetical protein